MNPVRELSKALDGALPSDFKEMLRVTKFVLDTKHIGLKIEPNIEDGMWHLKMLSDSDFAGDKETRISVTGYILYFCGVPIAWKSKGQKNITLSSSEAEYVACSEAVKEVQFVKQVVNAVDIKIQNL